MSFAGAVDYLALANSHSRSMDVLGTDTLLELLSGWSSGAARLLGTRCAERDRTGPLAVPAV
jgi:hypothetical protein